MKAWLVYVAAWLLLMGCAGPGCVSVPVPVSSKTFGQESASAPGVESHGPEDAPSNTPPAGIQAGSGSYSSAPYSWPAWARTARIAGAYFEPGDTDADIAQRLDELASQNVSVVLADSPWGEQYAVWVDDDRFYPVQALVAKVVQKAHTRGLKVVLYQTGLELLSEPERDPGLEHLDWAQRALDGTPLLFDDIRSEEAHWLAPGVWDLWLSPCVPGSGAGDSFPELSLRRVRDMVATGIDGLWVDQVYLQSSIGSHDDMWPSSDPCSAAAFLAATGLPMPAAEDWDDPVFLRWVVWRHTQIADFVLAVKDAARAVNPDLVFLSENANLDTGRSTYVANDPVSYMPYPDIGTGHEVETIADRMDEGETGMKHATLDQWLSFRTMLAFARAVDREKPSWILTYGNEPRDSAQLAGMVLAEGANFYETRGPQMADTVGAAYRTALFGWIADHSAALYGGRSAAEVGLVYSPRTRDLLDSVSGEPYDVADSVHFAGYRAAANLLYRAHIPFDVVIDTDTATLGRYLVLVLPEVQAISDATVDALHAFTGTLILSGDTAVHDDWMNERAVDALAGLTYTYLSEVNEALVALADTGLLETEAPPTLQLGLRRSSEGYVLILINTAAVPTAAFDLALRLLDNERVQAAHLVTLDGRQVDVPFSLSPVDATVQLSVPRGIDTAALLEVSTSPRSKSLYLPYLSRP